MGGFCSGEYEIVEQQCLEKGRKQTTSEEVRSESRLILSPDIFLVLRLPVPYHLGGGDEERQMIDPGCSSPALSWVATLRLKTTFRRLLKDVLVLWSSQVSFVGVVASVK